MDKTRQSYLYAGLAVFFWGTVPTAFKLCLGQMAIIPMLTIASVTSAVALFIILLSTGKTGLILKSTNKELLNSAILGFINPFLYYIILFRAYQLLPAQIAQPLNMIWPIILVFLSVPILHQKIGKKSFAALFISFMGVYLISSQGHPLNPVGANIQGIALATGSSVFWAFYFILNMRDRRDEAVKLFINFLFGSAYLIITLIITGVRPDEINMKAVIPAIYVGLFEMGITFFFWLKALQLAPTTDKISNLVYIAPFLSLFFVHFLLLEPIFYTTPAGLLLIISGILLQNKKQKGV